MLPSCHRLQSNYWIFIAMPVHSATPEGSTDLYSFQNNFTGPFMMGRLFSLFSISIFSKMGLTWFFISVRVRVITKATSANTIVPLEVHLNRIICSNIKYLNLFITRGVAVLMEQIEPTPLLEIPQSCSLKSLRIWLHGGLKLLLMCLSACFCQSATGLKEKTTSLNKLTPSSLIFFAHALWGYYFNSLYDEIKQQKRLTWAFLQLCAHTLKLHSKRAFPPAASLLAWPDT